MGSLPRFPAVKQWLRNWTETWNREGADSTRRNLLSFLSRWRNREGSWLLKWAPEFFHEIRHDHVGPEHWLEGFRGRLQRLHFCNHTIWHFEDEARRDDVSSDQIAEVKRGVDAVNQLRNDQMERIDEHVLSQFPTVCQDESVRLHSEPTGLMIDRISILTLKICHYRSMGKSRPVSLLHHQRDDLGEAYDRLLEDLSAGVRRIKVYRQCKTYNQPELNPALKSEEEQG